MKTITTNEWVTFKTSNPAGRATKKQRGLTEWQVNRYGEIQIIKSNGDIRKVKPSLSGGHPGSRYYCLSQNDFKYVHRIVATAFCPNPNNFKTVDHMDGNKLNNHFSNLQWVSNLTNAQLYWSRKNEKNEKNI